MKKTSWKSCLWTAIGAGLLVTGLSGCGTDAEPTHETPGGEVPINVRTLAVQHASLPEYVSVSGPLRPIRGADISTEESGVVATIERDKGSTIRRGESLLRLSRELLAAEMRSAAAGRTLAEHTESRMRELFAAKQISRQDLLRTEAEAANAKARAEIAQLRWERAEVKAPFDGIVAARFVELGQFVSAGMPVVRVVDPYTLEVRGSVSEREALWIRTGAKAAVTVDGSDIVLNGQVHWISVEAATNTGKFPVEIRVDNADLALRPGVVASAEILKTVHEDVIIIPRDAILMQAAGPVAFVVENERAVERQLTLGADQGLMVVVRHGLEMNDRLIVRGQRRVHHDTFVAVREEATALDGSVAGDPLEVRAAEAFSPVHPEPGLRSAEAGSESGS